MQAICSKVETSYDDGRVAYEEFILATIQSVSAIAKRVSIDTIIPAGKSISPQIQHLHAIFDSIRFKFGIPPRFGFIIKPYGLSRGFCRGLTHQPLPRGFPCG